MESTGAEGAIVAVVAAEGDDAATGSDVVTEGLAACGIGVGAAIATAAGGAFDGAGMAGSVDFGTMSNGGLVAAGLPALATVAGPTPLPGVNAPRGTRCDPVESAGANAPSGTRCEPLESPAVVGGGAASSGSMASCRDSAATETGGVAFPLRLEVTQPDRPHPITAIATKQTVPRRSGFSATADRAVIARRKEIPGQTDMAG